MTEWMLQSNVVYGPIRSRRLGTSLGINILPPDRKFCSYDCLYCQCGWTVSEDGHARTLPSAEWLLAAIDQQFRHWSEVPIAINMITLAGNGEPTLHPRFGEIVDGLLGLRDRWLPMVPVGVLSNSSTVHRLIIRQALKRLDERFMKLDAGCAEMWQQLNRPLGHPAWEAMLEGLRALQDVMLQSLFVSGSTENATEEAVADWIEAIAFVRPKLVHLYTVSRRPADPRVLPVPEYRLMEIGRRLTETTGVASEVFSAQ